MNFLAPVRAVLAIPVVILWTLICSLLTMLLAALSGGMSPVVYGAIRNVWAKPVLWWAGLRARVEGMEHLPREGPGFLVVFNHTSLLDIPLLFLANERAIHFGAKIELFRIPFFGRAMRMVGVLPIDRRQREKVIKMYEESVGRVKAGDCFALAPEGTRQPTADLGRFRRGPFEFAISAQMDIFPIVIWGAHLAMPNKSPWMGRRLWRNPVRVQVLPKVPAQGLTLDDADALSAQVHQQMAKALREVSQAC
jgi:1-acyl-sn-glycerol-3-phosphate acyltransferase